MRHPTASQGDTKTYTSGIAIKFPFQEGFCKRKITIYLVFSLNLGKRGRGCICRKRAVNLGNESKTAEEKGGWRKGQPITNENEKLYR
jgi:hypothetical protein